LDLHISWWPRWSGDTDINYLSYYIMPKVKVDPWQADYDAETMARYQEIISDKERRQRAMKAAAKKERDLEKSLKNMKAVTKRKK